MDRIVGIETEYGCLMSSEDLRCKSEVWPAKVKNYLFNKARAGTIDLNYLFFFSSRRRHTRLVSDWSSDVCSSDLDRTPAALEKGPSAPEHYRSSEQQFD